MAGKKRKKIERKRGKRNSKNQRRKGVDGISLKFHYGGVR